MMNEFYVKGYDGGPFNCVGLVEAAYEHAGVDVVYTKKPSRLYVAASAVKDGFYLAALIANTIAGGPPTAITIELASLLAIAGELEDVPIPSFAPNLAQLRMAIEADLGGALTPAMYYARLYGSTPTPPPATNGDWADVADTSWYSPGKTEFEIRDAKELAGLAKIVNEMTDTFGGKTIRLVSDIDLAGREWTPIGNDDYDYYSFRGTFDGGKHTISNMTVDIESSTSGVHAGLFGYNNGGTIKDVILSDFSVSSSSSSSSYYSYSSAGGLVGFNSNFGTITDCTASGSVSSSSSSSSYSYAGGLVGFNYYGTITDCTASGSASAAASSSSSYAGGLVGVNHEGTIMDCTASGTDITATSESGDEYARSGGFIGEFHSGTLSGVNSAAISPAIGRDDRLNPPGPSDDI
jgi:hypothetical protein